MGSKFWRQLIFAEGVLLLGLALGWILSPFLGPWEWLPLLVVTVTGLVLLGGVMGWERSKRVKENVTERFHLNQPLNLEVLRKALRAHGSQPELVDTPSLKVQMLKIQSTQKIELKKYTCMTLVNEGPSDLELELEGESQTLLADSWLRVGPYSQAATLSVSLERDAKQSFILVHSLLLAQGLD